jgi:hypothetical protein
MSDGGQDARHKRDEHHKKQRGYDRSNEHGEHEAGDHLHDQAAALEDIAERNEEQQSDGVAGLRGNGDMAHLSFGGVQAAAHLNEQRLIEIERGNGDAAGEAEQRDKALAGSCCVSGRWLRYVFAWILLWLSISEGNVPFWFHVSAST